MAPPTHTSIFRMVEQDKTTNITLKHYLTVIQDRRIEEHKQKGEKMCVCASTPQCFADYLQMDSGGLSECGGSPWHAVHMIKSVIPIQCTSNPLP